MAQRSHQRRSGQLTSPIASKDTTGHIIVGGTNYGQGSSREHAAIAPRFLGLQIVLAESFARIHWQNLTSFGVLALEFTDPGDRLKISRGDVLSFEGLRDSIAQGPDVRVRNVTHGQEYAVRHSLSKRQVEMVLAGGVIPWIRANA